MIREYLYAYSSVCPETGELFSLIMPACNNETMGIFIQELSEKFKDYRMVMLLDNAGWHTSKNLKIPENITLWNIPQYAPELNPVELIWRELRKEYFNNEMFESLDQVEERLALALKNYACDNVKLKNLTNFNWINCY